MCFEEGDAVSVALELEFEAIYPSLQLVPQPPRRQPSSRLQPRWLMVGVVAIGLLVLLALPVRAIGGKTVAGSRPSGRAGLCGPSGRHLTSIAREVQPRPGHEPCPPFGERGWVFHGSCLGSTWRFPDYRQMCAVPMVFGR